MKKLITASLLIINLLGVQAQSITQSNSVLWKISGLKLSKPSYIFITGTSCDETLILSQKVNNALKQVVTIAVEFDLWGSKDVNKLGSNNVATLDSQKLKFNLSNLELLQFNDILKNGGYPEQLIKEFTNYKISMLYYVLKMSDGPCGMTAEPITYERQFKPLAKKNKIAYNVLQNIDEFISENNSHTSNFWKRNIQYYLKNEQAIKLLVLNETDLYKTEKIESLQKMYQTNKYYQLQYDDSILQKHVNFLADKIEKEIISSPVFFSIDISNIVYKDRSVFELLKAKGYELTAVMQ